MAATSQSRLRVVGVALVLIATACGGSDATDVESVCPQDAVAQLEASALDYQEAIRSSLESEDGKWNPGAGEDEILDYITSLYCVDVLELSNHADEMAVALADADGECEAVGAVINLATAAADATNHLPLNTLHRQFVHRNGSLAACGDLIKSMWFDQVGTGRIVRIANDDIFGNTLAALARPDLLNACPLMEHAITSNLPVCVTGLSSPMLSKMCSGAGAATPESTEGQELLGAMGYLGAVGFHEEVAGAIGHGVTMGSIRNDPALSGLTEQEHFQQVLGAAQGDRGPCPGGGPGDGGGVVAGLDHCTMDIFRTMEDALHEAQAECVGRVIGENFVERFFPDNRGASDPMCWAANDPDGGVPGGVPDNGGTSAPEEEDRELSKDAGEAECVADSVIAAKEARLGRSLTSEEKAQIQARTGIASQQASLSPRTGFKEQDKQAWIEDYMAANSGQAPSAELVEAWSRTYDTKFDTKDGSTGGFYHPDSGSIVIFDDGNQVHNDLKMIHELVHAAADGEGLPVDHDPNSSGAYPRSEHDIAAHIGVSGAQVYKRKGGARTPTPDSDGFACGDPAAERAAQLVACFNTESPIDPGSWVTIPVPDEVASAPVAFCDSLDEFRQRDSILIDPNVTTPLWFDEDRLNDRVVSNYDPMSQVTIPVREP